MLKFLLNPCKKFTKNCCQNENHQHFNKLLYILFVGHCCAQPFIQMKFYDVLLYESCLYILSSTSLETMCVGAPAALKSTG